MKRPPTIEQAKRIQAIVERVTPGISFKHQAFSWGSDEEKREAYALMDDLGVKRPKSSCFSCYVDALAGLSVLIGLDEFRHPDPARAERRMAVCVQCPAYRKRSRSCGRLVWGHFFPKPMKIDGAMVTPCGCFLPAKTPLKHSHCPAGKW